MVTDFLKNAGEYSFADEDFAKAFAFLATLNDKSPVGKTVLSDTCYVNVMFYNSKRADEGRFESHRDYIDIQYVISGDEIIEVAPVDALKPETDGFGENDCAFYGIPEAPTALRMEAGSFAVLYPREGHRPGMARVTPAPVMKAVVKVKVK